jgi:hypothetical protein
MSLSALPPPSSSALRPAESPQLHALSSNAVIKYVEEPWVGSLRPKHLCQVLGKFR